MVHVVQWYFFESMLNIYWMHDYVLCLCQDVCLMTTFGSPNFSQRGSTQLLGGCSGCCFVQKYSVCVNTVLLCHCFTAHSSLSSISDCVMLSPSVTLSGWDKDADIHTHTHTQSPGYHGDTPAKGQPNKGPFFLSVPHLTVKSLFVFVYNTVLLAWVATATPHQLPPAAACVSLCLSVYMCVCVCVCVCVCGRTNVCTNEPLINLCRAACRCVFAQRDVVCVYTAAMCIQTHFQGSNWWFASDFSDLKNESIHHGVKTKMHRN